MAEPRLVRLRGDSMRPRLAAGDLLRVGPLAGAPAVGEVIVFAAGDGTRVAHRVSGRAADGRLRTRGDAHARDDDEAVALPRVEGRVVGVLRGAPFRVARAPALLRPLGAIYRALARRPRVRALVRRWLRPELARLRLDGPAGPLVKILHRGRTVAVLHLATGRMQVRFPWALVVEPPGPPP